MKPELGSAKGRDFRMRSRADWGLRAGFLESRWAIRMVVERDFPMALEGGHVSDGYDGLVYSLWEEGIR